MAKITEKPEYNVIPELCGVQLNGLCEEGDSDVVMAAVRHLVPADWKTQHIHGSQHQTEHGNNRWQTRSS